MMQAVAERSWSPAGEATAVTPRARDTTAGAAVSTAAAAAEAGARGAAAAEVRGNRAAPRPAKRPCRTAKLETSEHLKDMNELFRKELNSNFCAR